MSPPQGEPVPGSVEDWLRRARGDLAIAEAPLPEGALLEDLCFHTQQAVEKALKAVYLHNGWTFRYTHDLETLMSGLAKEGLEIPEAVLDTDTLSAYAWEARYPGLYEPITEAELEKAINMAEIVLTWAQDQTTGTTKMGSEED